MSGALLNTYGIYQGRTIQMPMRKYFIFIHTMNHYTVQVCYEKLKDQIKTGF